MIDFNVARLNMVESQIRPNAVTDRAVLEAFLAIPRERFLPPALQRVAYVDERLPLGGRRWLLEPMVLARLIQLAEIGKDDIVLDIGCGSGYTAAVLARLARQVVAIDSDRPLVEQAVARLRELGAGNVLAVEAPLAEGYPARAPYDVILIEGGATSVPEAIGRQLAEGGRLVTIMGEEGNGVGHAVLMSKSAGVLSRRPPVFDAAAPLLPGYERAPSFQF
jgi:protein-L-isoaspartate(D-aspartate) O-methyltransferase